MQWNLAQFKKWSISNLTPLERTPTIQQPHFETVGYTTQILRRNKPGDREDHKTLIPRSCLGENFEEVLSIKHLPLIENLEKMSLTLDARTNIEFYR